MIPARRKPTHSADWRREWREAIVDPAELLAVVGLPHLAELVARVAPHGFPLRVPRAFVARMRRGDPDDPLLRQVLPLRAENAHVAGFGLDPVGDLAALRSAGAGVLQKYAGRALLIATGSCAIHCRYCFRRHFPYADAIAARDGWQAAIDWLRVHPGVDEVILSGGDPLSLATDKLAALGMRLRELPQVTTLRIHTRLPIVLPSRVDDALVEWLRASPWSKVVVVHVNHAQEMDAEVDEALARLRHAGCLLLNQSVLLRGVNDSVDALENLSRRLLQAGVLPYYLHVLDAVSGAAHFAVDDVDALALVESLRQRLPGYLLPRLVREIEGEPAKSPLDGRTATFM